MLASINPLGERARRTRWGRTMAWYLAGSTAGGLAIGVVAGGVGLGLRLLFGPGQLAVGVAAVAVCAVALLFEMRVGGLALPTVHRQVNENWLARYRGWVYGTGFGFQLGLGVATIVTTAAVYVAVLLAVLTGSIAGGMIVLGTFGFVRALPLLAAAKAHGPAEVRQTLRRAHAWTRRAQVLASASLVVVGAAAALSVVA
jgi:hypothetical protein